MTQWMGFFWLLLLLASMAWVVVTVIVPLVLPMAIRSRLSPASRLHRIELIAALSWLAPLTVVLAACAAAAAKSLGWIEDHCLLHGGGAGHHPHLCFTHLPAIELSYLYWLAAGLLGTAMILSLSIFLLREQGLAARVRALQGLAPGRRRLRILDEDSPLAFAAGLRHSLVLISRGLLERLTRRERRLVLAHEVTHLRHRDLPRNLVFEGLLRLHLPWTARRLRAAWRQALEERADDCVAARYGREAVAETLLKVMRQMRMGCSAGLSIAGADRMRRIERLLSPVEAAGQTPVFLALYVCALGAGALFVVGAHHGTETLLGFLLAG